MNGSLPGSSVHGGSPGKNTGVGCHALLQGIFPTQGLNPGLPHCRQILYHLSHQGSPRILEGVVLHSPGDLPNPGIEPGSPALQVDSLPAQLPGKPNPNSLHPDDSGPPLLMSLLKAHLLGGFPSSLGYNFKHSHFLWSFPTYFSPEDSTTA